MFLELIATFAAGIGAAGFVLALNLITKGRLPKWAMPVAAGLAMIGVAISNEYSWGARTAEGLPEGVAVIEEIHASQWFRPWSYLAPPTVRLIAADGAGVQTRPDQPEVKLVDLYLFARWQPPAKVPQLVHCGEGTRADVTQASLADPTQARWSEAAPRLIAELCGS